MLGYKTFIEKTQPINIIKVISEDLLERLIDSHCLVSKTGVAVYYPDILPADIENLELFMLKDYARLEPLNFPFCWQYRHLHNCCQYDEVCKKWDKRTVLKYYKGDWIEPKMFHCYLGLWEMAYPLYAGGRLLGVLYGGQIVITENVQNWRTALESIKDEIVWSPLDEKQISEIPEKSDQVTTILKAINDNEDILAKDKLGLNNLLNKAINNEGVKVDTLLERYKEFKRFGKALEGVLENLYISQAEAEMRRHIEICGKELTISAEKLDETDEKLWETIDTIMEETVPDIMGYVLYVMDEHEKGPRTARMQELGERKNVKIYRKTFRNLCETIFRFVEDKKKFVRYDIMAGSAPKVIKDLFHDAVQLSGDYSWYACAMGIPLLWGEDKLLGGLVCVTAGYEVNKGIYKKDRLVAYISEHHTAALCNVASIISTILSRYASEQERIASQTVRAHELVSPVHAIEGYQFILSKMFEYDIEHVETIRKEILSEFKIKLVRLGDLCKLLALIATSNSLEALGEFIYTNFEKNILLPIVQPLRAYAFEEKRTKIWYSEDFLQIPKIWVMKEGIERCIFNLLMNAVKYSRSRSEINVTLNKTQESFEICVVNRGIGVPPMESEIIFHRFKRGSNAGEVAAYGAGLGLYIARTIARKHGGDIRLVDGRPESTIFKLILPRSLEYEQGQYIAGEKDEISYY